MKLLFKWIAGLLLAGVASVVLIVVLLMIPGVQRGVVHFAGSRVADSFDVQRFGLTLGGLEIEGIQFRFGEVEGGWSSIAARVDWRRSVGERRLVAESLEVLGFYITLPDVREGTTAEEPVDPEVLAEDIRKALEGLKGLVLTQYLTLGRGRVEFGLTQGARKLDAVVQIQDWAPNNQADVDVDWRWRDTSAERVEQYADYRGRGRLLMNIGADGEFTGGKMEGDVRLSVGEKLLGTVFFGAILDAIAETGVLPLTVSYQPEGAPGAAFSVFDGVIRLPMEGGVVSVGGRVGFETAVFAPLFAAQGVVLPEVSLSSQVDGSLNWLTETGSLQLGGEVQTEQIRAKVDLSAVGGLQPDLQFGLRGRVVAALLESAEQLDFHSMDLQFKSREGVLGSVQATITDGQGDQSVVFKVRAPMDVSLPIELEARSERIQIDSFVKALTAFTAALPQSGVDLPEGDAPLSGGEVSGPWFEREIRVLLGVDRLDLAGALGLDLVDALVVAKGDAVSVDRSQFQFLDGTLSHTGSLERVGEGYRLGGAAEFSELTLATILASVGQLRLAEAGFGGKVTYGGQADDLAQLGEAIEIGWSLAARDGKINVPSDNILGTVRGATRITSAIGFVLPGQSYLGEFETLIKRMNEILFDTFVIEGKRLPSGILEIGNAELKGPEFYAQLKGRVLGTGWDDLMGAAMRFELDIGAKGVPAKAAERIGMSEGRTREDYSLWNRQPFIISGSLEQPDFSQLAQWGIARVGGRAVRQIVSPLDERRRSGAQPTEGAAPLLDGFQDLLDNLGR